jgi:hypothetical protein
MDVRIVAVSICFLCFANGCGGKKQDQVSEVKNQTGFKKPDNESSPKTVRPRSTANGGGAKSNSAGLTSSASKGSSTPGATTSQGSQVPSKAGAAKNTIKLIKAGAEPRRKLRYKFKANLSEKMVMDTYMSMALQLGARKQPETKLPGSRSKMTVTTKDVTPAGAVNYEFTMDGVEVLPTPGASQVAINAAKAQVKSMQGMTGSATVSPRGFTKKARINLPEGISPQVAQLMNNMKRSLDQLSIMLPAEEVGKGAVWQVTMPVKTPMFTLTQVVTYTIWDVTENTVKLDSKVTQFAEPQDVKVGRIKARLESLRTSGIGTIEMNLASLVPKSMAKLTTKNVMSANGRKISTTMRITVNLSKPKE